MLSSMTPTMDASTKGVLSWHRCHLMASSSRVNLQQQVSYPPTRPLHCLPVHFDAACHLLVTNSLRLLQHRVLLLISLVSLHVTCNCERRDDAHHTTDCQVGLKSRVLCRISDSMCTGSCFAMLTHALQSMSVAATFAQAREGGYTI